MACAEGEWEDSNAGLCGRGGGREGRPQVNCRAGWSGHHFSHLLHDPHICSQHHPQILQRHLLEGDCRPLSTLQSPLALLSNPPLPCPILCTYPHAGNLLSVDDALHQGLTRPLFWWRLPSAGSTCGVGLPSCRFHPCIECAMAVGYKAHRHLLGGTGQSQSTTWAAGQAEARQMPGYSLSFQAGRSLVRSPTELSCRQADCPSPLARSFLR